MTIPYVPVVTHVPVVTQGQAYVPVVTPVPVTAPTEDVAEERHGYCPEVSFRKMGRSREEHENYHCVRFRYS